MSIDHEIIGDSGSPVPLLLFKITTQVFRDWTVADDGSGVDHPRSWTDSGARRVTEVDKRGFSMDGKRH